MWGLRGCVRCVRAIERNARGSRARSLARPFSLTRRQPPPPSRKKKKKQCAARPPTPASSPLACGPAPRRPRRPRCGPRWSRRCVCVCAGGFRRRRGRSAGSWPAAPPRSSCSPGPLRSPPPPSPAPPRQKKKTQALGDEAADALGRVADALDAMAAEAAGGEEGSGGAGVANGVPKKAADKAEAAAARKKRKKGGGE